MAKVESSVLLQHIRGKIGKQVVIKQYADKTVITAYPQTVRRKPGYVKKVFEDRFADAIKYAKAIICNRELKQAYQAKMKPGQRVYNYAISEYLTRLRENDKRLLQQSYKKA